MMKRFGPQRVLALGLMIGLCAPAGAQINVRVNGERVAFYGTQPQQVSGRVMVPLRGVLEKLGANVDWDASTQTVTANRGNTNIELPIGGRTASVNGNPVDLDVPAMVIGGSTMVPLRFVSEALGADVSWMSATQTVRVDTKDAGLTSRTYAHRSDIQDQRDYRQTDNYQNGRVARQYNNYQNDRYYRPDSGNYQPRAHVTRQAETRVTLASGTVIPMRLDQSLSSRDNQRGDRFTGTIRSGENDAGLPYGTKVEGVITEAIPSRDGKPGVLDVEFRRLILPDGATRSIDANLYSLDGKSVRSENGRLVARGGGNSQDRLKWVGIGAAGGLIVGALTKQNSLLSLLLGAGAGYAYNELGNKKAGEVNLHDGADFGVRLNQSVSFTRAELDRSR